VRQASPDSAVAVLQPSRISEKNPVIHKRPDHGPRRPKLKIRFRYAKLGRIRWTSQRDVARMWERALRRAAVPVAQTSGFSPRPKLSFGLALPTGSESMAEYLDVELSEPLAVPEVSARLDGLFPTGIHITGSAELTEKVESLQQDVVACSWLIDVPGTNRIDLQHVIETALRATSLPVRRQRKGREEDDDVRQSIRELEISTANDEVARFRALLETRPRGVRPSELGRALGIELGLSCRTHQWIEREGSLEEPLVADAARLAALERAS
jgi:radical SAM-linked protein